MDARDGDFPTYCRGGTQEGRMGRGKQGGSAGSVHNKGRQEEGLIGACDG